jgi:uncharacterized membrane protein
MSKRMFTMLVIRGLSLTLFFSLFPACSEQPVYPDPPRTGRDIVVDVNRLPSGNPLFFTYHYHDKKISFFVVRVNNTALSFLDACIGCYTKKRGYRFDNGQVICRECGVKYPVSEMEKGFGSCVPIKIAGHVQDGKYYIPLSLLEEQADKF